jgi:hypothetical protein
VTKLQDPDTDLVLLELFLVYFTAIGVAMTEPVEEWIRTAGKRCDQIGLLELGDALRRHSDQEAGHHLMLIEDARTLIDWWNGRQPVALDAAPILGRQMTEGVRRYRVLHEDSIAGNAPYSQLAIEYEIEGLSVRLGPQFIDRYTTVLGPTAASGLRFLRHHVSLDLNHTRFNQGQLARLLQQHPEFLDVLVTAGEEALRAYATFLDDCWLLAETKMEQVI